MKKEPKVAIIITTYNQDVLLEQTLSSLKNSTLYKNYKTYLVDDCSKKNIGETIRKKFSWVNIIVNKTNQGFSKANNIGMEKSIKEYNPDYILLLNDDIEIVEKNWLKKIVSVAESDKKIGIVGCKLIYPDGSLQSLGGHLKKWEISQISKLKEGEILDVDHVMGACFLIKKGVIDEIGMLDPIFSPYLLEDTDYCLRAKKKGFLIKTVSSVEVIHKKGQTINSLKDKRSLLIRFKNDIIFSRRHLKFKDKFFRIFAYLPLVAILKKKKDTDQLKLKNFELRRDFLINMYFFILAFIPRAYKKVIEK